MINKYYNSNKDLKEYRASKVKTGIASNGKPYTVFSIADKIGENKGKGIYDNYSVFSWQDGIRLADGDKIVLEDIYALEVKEVEYNGQKRVNKTIFADIKVTKTSLPPKQPDVIGELPDLTSVEQDSLPF